VLELDASMPNLDKIILEIDVNMPKLDMCMLDIDPRDTMLISIFK
jgi:hypothetical protein